MASEPAPFERVKKGVVKRSQRRVLGVFIDGVGLDRASRRVNRKVDLAALVRGVSGGLEPIVARYYSLIPHEDDSRQHAFFDAVHRAGLEVVLKRLPPKTVDRAVTIDIQMAADIVAFAGGHNAFSQEAVYLPEEHLKFQEQFSPKKRVLSEDEIKDASRVVIVICPSGDLSYAISLAGELGADTVTADFAPAGRNVMKSAAKWIDLSDSETIWKE